MSKVLGQETTVQEAGAGQTRLEAQRIPPGDRSLDFFRFEAAVVPENVLAHDVGIFNSVCHVVQAAEQAHDLLVQCEERLTQAGKLLFQELSELFAGPGRGWTRCNHTLRVRAGSAHADREGRHPRCAKSATVTASLRASPRLAQ